MLITIAGKEIDVRLTMAAMERVAALYDGKYPSTKQLNDDFNDYNKLFAVVEAMTEDPEITRDWLFAKVRPGTLVALRLTVLAASAEGWSMETVEGEEKNAEVVDVTLEEIKKKERMTPRSASDGSEASG